MRRALLTALPVFALDQLSKYAVVVGLNLDAVGRVEVAPPYLVFQMAWNRGVNFGLLSNDSTLGPWLLVALSVAVSVALALWSRRMRGWTLPAAVGLVIGGALGNAIDRVLWGAVADFINMSCCGFTSPWSFNVADIAIFAGAAALIVFSGREGKPAGRKR
ncbi:signal peptidase II [Paroceanicella profunda]|uniref:Lipoprotein signal peptidase n=1 Tax=Paroceanicella profunda TaxID=2579971 RepID=A0A5B8FIU6_9RHOB|nr:signal peptidase II [Paroceanicella profunda]